jgi:RHS repeat-associated protein
VIGLADGNGVIKTSYNYSPFGKRQATGASSDNPFTFTGREDDGTGLYYYRARYYSPDQKRFIAADPLGFGGGDSNFYAYVGNNPINFTDPSGKSVESFAQGLVVGGAKGAVVGFALGVLAAASGVTLAPAMTIALALGGGALLIKALNEISNEPCPDKRDYLYGELLGGLAGGLAGGGVGGRLGAGTATAGENNAANRALHEAYKDGLRAAMEKPTVSDKKLSELVDALYRPNAKVGSGSTAAAVREELLTGQPVGGAFHSLKAEGGITALQKWLNKNPTARPGDRAAAENIIRDMSNALRGQ